MREPRGLTPSPSRMTTALSSKRMLDPSERRYSLAVRTITAFTIDLDPNNEPSDQSTLVDLNKVARDTGAVTSVLSSVATIATGANTATGTIDGTQAVSVGDLLQFDVDQGSDGQDLIATVEITPS